MDSNQTVIQSEEKNLTDLLLEQLTLKTVERKLQKLMSIATVQITALKIDELQLKSMLEPQNTGDQFKSTDDQSKSTDDQSETSYDHGSDDDVMHVRTNKIDDDNFDEVNRQIISLDTFLKKAELDFESECFKSESESE